MCRLVLLLSHTTLPIEITTTLLDLLHVPGNVKVKRFLAHGATSVKWMGHCIWGSRPGPSRSTCSWYYTVGTGWHKISCFTVNPGVTQKRPVQQIWPMHVIVGKCKIISVASCKECVTHKVTTHFGNYHKSSHQQQTKLWSVLKTVGSNSAGLCGVKQTEQLLCSRYWLTPQHMEVV